MSDETTRRAGRPRSARALRDPDPNAMPWPQGAAISALLVLAGVLASGLVDPMLAWTR